GGRWRRLPPAHARTRSSRSATGPRHEGLGMGSSPLQELFVLREHGIDYLIEHVLRRFAEKVRVCIERFVVLAIEPSPMLDELLAARARLDQRHTVSFPEKSDMLSNVWRCT